MIPAQRFYIFLGLGMAIALFLANFFDQTLSILTTLVFDGLLLAIGIWDGYQVKINQIKIQRQPLHRLSIGRDNPVILTVETQKQAANLIIKDSYPTQFKVDQSPLKTSLSPQSKTELAYHIYPHQRGEFEWGDLYIRQLSPWGLMWRDWKISASQKVAVYPDLVGLRSLSIRLTLENTGNLSQTRRLGMGTEFSELRDYGTGDDPRLINWKATARHSRPLVRVLEPEKEQTLIILLDRGRLMTAQVQGLKRFDWGLNATLSLALAGLNRGDKVGVGVFDREIITWIPPERGQHQLSQLIERLTPIQPILLEPDYRGAVTKLVTQQTRRALVVLVTDIVDQTASSELLSALVALSPRYLPFCVTLRDPQVDQLAGKISISREMLNPLENASNQNIITTYNRAVALDLLNQRQVAFAQLKQKGVLVLDTPANQMSEEIVTRYLQLKARNLL